MASPIKGGHVNIRESKLAEVRQFYPSASKEHGYLVEMVDRSPIVGRPRVYVAAPGGERWCLWLSQVKAFPRCPACEKEGHTLANHSARKASAA